MAGILSFDRSLVKLPKKLGGDGYNYSREYISGGDRGTAQTIKRMADMVSLRKRDEAFRAKYVIPILNGQVGNAPRAAEKDYAAYCENLFLFCRDQIRYVHDPSGVELIEDPLVVLQRGAADCDSICILLCAMCESIGRQCRFVTIRKENNGGYFHVYSEVHIPGRGWVGMDATMKDKPFGWRPDPKFAATSWPASRDANEVDQEDVRGMEDLLCPSTQDLRGLSGLDDIDDTLIDLSSTDIPTPSQILTGATNNWLPTALLLGVGAYFLFGRKRGRRAR